MKTKLKSVIATTLIAGTILVPSNVFADDQKPITVFVDGQQLNFEVPPLIKEGSMLVPLRAVFEKLGLKVEWDANTKTITGTKDGLSFHMQIGNKEASVNGRAMKLEVPPNIIDGSTFVPLRFVGESSGNDIDWDGLNQRVDVRSKGSSTYVTNVNNSAGGTYTGEFKDGQPDGKGVLINADGSKFEGTFQNGQFNGYGVFTNKDGVQYSGDWKNGLKDGKVKIVTPKGTNYDGSWKNDVIDGYGISTYDSGERYEGYWQSGMWNGKGKLTYANGYYDGNFKDDKYDGLGAEYDRSGNLIRSGTYSNGQLVTAGPGSTSNGSNNGQAPSSPTNPASPSNKLDQVNPEYNRHMQALQTLKNAHDKTINFIDDKITSIRRSSTVGFYSESEYNQKLASLQSQAQSKQNLLDALAMDNSPEGASRSRKLSRELADLEQQLKNLQDGHSAQVQIQALEDQRKQEDRDYQAKVQAENTLHQSNLDGLR